MNERGDKTAKREHELLATKAKELFDESVRELDGETMLRLNRARHRALAQLRPGARPAQWLQWTTAAGIAVAAIVAVVMLDRGPPVEELMTPASVGDFEILLNQDSFEMLEELEFYSWIDFEAELESNGNVG
jgi:hypothetical protein